MGSIEDNHWVDMIINEIGFALTKVDELIQKSIELWTELTKDKYDDQPTHDTTGQPNNGISGEEDSSQDKSVAEVKERPIQDWPMCLGDAMEIPSQHWAMRASTIPESLIQEQGDDDDCDDEYDYNEENKKEDDEGTVSESSDEHIWELNLKNSIRNHWPNCYQYHIEEANLSSLKWKDAYEQLKNFDMPSEEEDESWDDDYDEEKEEEDETTVSKSCENMSKMNHLMRRLGSCYLSPIHPLHEENNASYMMKRNPYQLSKNDDASSKKDDDEEEEEEEEEETTVSESCEEPSEINFETWRTSYIPSRYHHRNEEDTGCWILMGRGSYVQLKNDGTSFAEEDDSWDNEEVMEWMWMHGSVSDVMSSESLVVHDDEDEDDDEVLDKLQGFVDVKEEVETLFPECDWVYDEELGL